MTNPTNRYKLRGHVAGELIVELAKGEKTQAQLAERFGVSQPSISDFAIKHRDDIERQRADMQDRFAGAWVADKLARVHEYQRTVETINEALDDPAVDGAVPEPELMRVKHQAMRSVAEELNQLPARMQVQVSGAITTTIEGVNLDNLR